MDDIKSAATHAEQLVESTAGQLTEKSKEAQARLNGALERAKHSCEELQERAAASLRNTENTIKANPLKTVGIALGVGLLLGLLLKRRD